MIEVGERVPEKMAIDAPIGFFIRDFYLLNHDGMYCIVIGGKVAEIHSTREAASKRMIRLMRSVDRFIDKLMQPPRSTDEEQAQA